MIKAANDNTPRLLTQKAAAKYVGVSVPTFATWVTAGIIPPAIAIMRKWDRKAIDRALDLISGLEKPVNSDEGYQLRKQERHAKKLARTG